VIGTPTRYSSFNAVLTDPARGAGQHEDMFLHWTENPVRDGHRVAGPSGKASRYDRPMPRLRARRRRTPKRTRRCADNLDAGQFDEPEWVWVGDQRMFVVGYTPGGVPFGCFEDELDNLR
jgi:hypothetical protein